MPGLNIYMLTNHNYSELLENILVLLILNFYISTDKLFQCWYSCFLKRVYKIHNLTFSWGVSPYYKTNYCTILKHMIAKPYSITEESERFLALKWTTPGWSWCFLKMLPPVCFLAANGHFQLWLACLTIVASTSIFHF